MGGGPFEKEILNERKAYFELGLGSRCDVLQPIEIY